MPNNLPGIQNKNDNLPGHEKKYDVYILYDQKDYSWAHDELGSRLKKASIKVFFDKGTYTSPDRWNMFLNKVINDCYSIVYIISDTFLIDSDSNRENWRVKKFIQLRNLGKPVLIPVVLNRIPDTSFFNDIIPPLFFQPIFFYQYNNLDSKEKELLWKKVINAIRKAKKSQQSPKNNITIKTDDASQITGSSNVTLETISIDAKGQVGEPTITTGGPSLQPSLPEETIEVPSHALSDAYSEEDLLGYSDYVDALADFIQSPETQKPLVIGIDAPWGGGKTSLMHMLENRLRPPMKFKPKFGQWPWNWGKKSSFYTVWFNAWQYDQEESLWSALVLDILKQVSKQLRGVQRLGMSFSLNLRRFDLTTFLEDLGKSVLFALALTTIGFAAFIGLARILGASWSEALGWLRHYIKVLAGLEVISLLYTGFKDVAGMLVSPFNLGISKYLKTPKYKEKIGFLGQFQDDFENVVETVSSKGKWPLAIFIDDLDRCTPDKAVSVIEAINLLLDSPSCVFVIGMDTQTVASSIQAKYKELVVFFSDPNNPGGLSIGRKFLEKIIQIDFRIPKSDLSHIDNFIEAQLGKKPSQEEYPLEQQIAESLIQAEQRAGKTVDQAKNVIQESYPNLADVLEESVKTIKARAFEELPEVIQAIKDMAPILENNPRKIKRFINIYRLEALISYRRGILGSTIKFDNLARWIVITMRWPEFIQEVLQDSRVIGSLAYDMTSLGQINDPVEKRKRFEEIRISAQYTPSINSLLLNPDFSKILFEMQGFVGEAQNYLNLAQLFIPPI